MKALLVLALMANVAMMMVCASLHDWVGIGVHASIFLSMFTTLYFQERD
jgi:hypothetical protein